VKLSNAEVRGKLLFWDRSAYGISGEQKNWKDEAIHKVVIKSFPCDSSI
jgi:hypothetical protein